ncbi:hypothetical protein OEIGOIKO_05840 [Streptomyces chrestomyceticus JCM 4735]|uniref:Uncharacterized protein n=1 Tax=Streptomyces chrestomyceticus JCM 4735 TaxID=1306181 RepID=A0A7U9Q0M9_9ACTN|nr:hypothetical protein [Streptomyces chrestomyceticus]GCD38030.1 hypothetical protein OEIGOIKO_05840 [Streptomyces chrestomyceticus JCM 4735]
MTARDELFSALMWPEWSPASEGYGAGLPKTTALLAAFRAEVLREAAAVADAATAPAGWSADAMAVWTACTSSVAHRLRRMADAAEGGDDDA